MTQAMQERPATSPSPPPPTKRRKVDDDNSPPKYPENGRAGVDDAPGLNGLDSGKLAYSDHPRNRRSDDRSSDRPSDIADTSVPDRRDFNPTIPGRTHRSSEGFNSQQSHRHDAPYDTANRGSYAIGGSKNSRPSRRPELPEDDPSSNQAAPHRDSRSIPRMEPTGLAPEVDAVLARIFASGLFERKDIDGRALEFLGRVSPNLALAALEDIQRRDFSTVRNKPAFIMSIFKRVVAGGSASHSQPPPVPPPGGFAPTSVPASALAHLPPAVSEALQRVFTSGVCHPRQFDDRAMDILVDLPEPDAVRALSEFAAMEPGRVRNPSAFWMGLARKFKGHSRIPGPRVPYDGNPPSNTYGSYESGIGYDNRRVNSAGSTAFSPALEHRLDELSASGHLPRSALDDRALEALRRLPEQDALGVLGELPDPSRVRNMSAYVMGLCKKFASGEARSLSGRGVPYGGGGGYSSSYGGAYGGGSGGGSAYGPQGGGYGGGYGGYGGSTVPNAYPSAGYGNSAPGPYGSSNSSYGVNSSSVGGSYGGSGGMSHHHGGDSGRVRDMRDARDARNSRGGRDVRDVRDGRDVRDIRDIREALNGMDPTVKDRFYAMTEQGIISETSFDARAIDALQSMRREEACAALDELAASEPGRIHNISAYFMGLAKKFGRATL